MDHVFTVEQARRLLPEVRARADQLVAVRADLVELSQALKQGDPSSVGGIPEAKALEARFGELLDWFPANGIDVKSYAPLLLDFPSQIAGENVHLCWLEGEANLGWYHRPEHGFAGRRPIPG